MPTLGGPFCPPVVNLPCPAGVNTPITALPAQLLAATAMAKWGEGDPRWVVEHREDGKNVNAWHWNEVPKISWCRERLGQLLPGVAAAVAPASIVVKEVKAVNGDVGASRGRGEG